MHPFHTTAKSIVLIGTALAAKCRLALSLFAGDIVGLHSESSPTVGAGGVRYEVHWFHAFIIDAWNAYVKGRKSY